MNDRRLSRLKAIHSLHVVECPDAIASQFIPMNADRRDTLYYEYLKQGIMLPKYSDIERKHLRERDLKVLASPWYIIFDYKGNRYRLDYKRGFVWDGASIPVIFRFGNGTAHNHYMSIPAIVHDALFAMKFLPYEDANNVFSGLLRWKGLPKFTLGRIMLGVRSPVGRRLYRKSNPNNSWMNGFVSFSVIEK